MKPGDRTRAYGRDTDVDLLGVGSAHHVSDPAGDRPAGRLLVPDPESRSGWREFYVARRAGPDRRAPLGFRPGGSR